MKKFAIKSISFFLFFAGITLLLNSVYLVILITTDWDFGKRIESLRFKNPDFELLVMGSSLAEYGIDTEFLTSEGVKSYNFAFVGSSVKTYFIQLNEYLSNYSRKPSYVLLASNAELEEFDQEGIHPVVEFTMKDQKIDFKDVPLSKFRWQGTELFKKALSKEYRSGHVSFGQLKRNKAVPDNSKFRDLILNLEKYRSAYWIGRLAELCAAKGIELLIIEVPGVKETQNISGIGPYVINFSNGSSASLYNLNSRDFCEFIDSDNDWVGMSHFNEKGAARFTNELLRIMQLNNTLKGIQSSSNIAN